MIRGAVYCRVSTSDQRDEGTSLDTQRDKGLVKAAEMCWEIPPEYIIQEDWTGKDLRRPGVQRLLELARSGKIKGIIIYTLDRLYRPENDGDEWRVFELLQQFQEAGAEVVWVDTSIPTKGPLSSIFTFLDAWRSGRERRAIMERTSRGRLEKARRGKVVSRAAAPFGYRYDPKTSTLSICEEEAEVVRMVFHFYTQERISLVKLADRLNRMGIARPRGGQRWHLSTLGRMLRNETYAGTLWQNHWQTDKMPAKAGTKGKSHQRPKNEQIPTQVPPIITREIFDVAQKRLAENLRLAQRNTKREYLLTGLLKHTCGSSMGGRTNHGLLYYCCFGSNTFKAPINEKGEPQPCPCKWVKGDALEAAVWDTVTGLLRQPELLTRELERLTEPNSTTRETLEAELAEVRKRLEKVPKEERRLVEGYRKGFYTDFTMREETEQLRMEKDAAAERRCELERQISHLDKAMSYRGQVEELVQKLSSGLETMDFNERRELLRLLVDEIIYDDGQITIKTIIPLDERRLHSLSEGVRGRGNWIPAYAGMTGKFDVSRKER